MDAADAPFLAAIRAYPHDTAARLVYADWLQERDDPRHELVRVCEAMREVPVWSDRYWELKARRNELWAAAPLDWLEATGYDGGRYDPVFRDGVPADVRGRWRLIREFTERWHGVGVPDCGGRRAEVRAEEARLGVELPESVREFIAFWHDLAQHGTPGYDRRRGVNLLEDVSFGVEWLASPPARRSGVALLAHVQDSGVLGVADVDLGTPDPPADYLADEALADTPVADPAWSILSAAAFYHLFYDLPAVSRGGGYLSGESDLPERLAAAFPVRARFGDADVFETDDRLLFVYDVVTPPGAVDRRAGVGRGRRPTANAPAFGCLFASAAGGHSGWSQMPNPETFRRRQDDYLRLPARPAVWVSVPRRLRTLPL